MSGEQRDDLHIVVAEILAVLFLGQVEVAVDDVAQDDRHAEERSHRRMPRREADQDSDRLRWKGRLCLSE